MKRFIVKICGHVFLCFAAALPVCATIINFETQAANTGGNLTGIPNSPLTIGIATFTGGELRDAENELNADQTGVYASEGLFGSGETNPLVITFASAVSDFSVLVVNADGAGSYTVSDNLGDWVTMSLASINASGAAIFSLPGNGLTKVDITSFDADSWNFAIDNVTFATSTSTPEPESLLLVAAGVILLAAIRYGQPRARYTAIFLSAPLAAREHARFSVESATKVTTRLERGARATSSPRPIPVLSSALESRRPDEFGSIASFKAKASGVRGRIIRWLHRTTFR